MWRARPRQQIPIQCCQMWSNQRIWCRIQNWPASPASNQLFSSTSVSKYPAKGINYRFPEPSMRRRSCSGKPPNWNGNERWRFLPVRMQPPLQSFHPPQTRSKHASSPAKEDCPSARTGPDRHPSQNNQSRQDKQRHSHKKHLANPVNVPLRQMVRTRYVRRFRNTLEEGHILKLASQGPASWINQAFLSYLSDEVEKKPPGHPPRSRGDSSGRPPSHTPTTFPRAFGTCLGSQVKCPQMIRRPIINWSSSATRPWPPTCANCLERRATQEHIAECNNLFAEDFPSIPIVSVLKLSSPPQPENAPQALLQIAKRIATAVQRSIPDYDFAVLLSWTYSLSLSY